MLVSNIDWDEYVGRIAIGKVISGEIKQGQSVYALNKEGGKKIVKITKMKTFTGLKTNEIETAYSGDIVGLAGFDSVNIGDTLSLDENSELIPFVEIDPPTIQMEFSVNNGPLAGRDGKKVTSRQINERLEKETQSNISISIDESKDSTKFLVNARGSMQIAVLVETMRREGYEVLVSRPTVLFKDINNQRHEPFEQIWIETDEDHLGSIMENLSKRKIKISNLDHHNAGVTIEANGPTRGIIGLESDINTITSGNGFVSHSFLEYRPYCGEIITRKTGTLVSMDQGKSMPYALDMIQNRGKLFIEPGEDIYGGQIIGENPRKEDLIVNPTKAKQLDNMRASGSDKGIQLAPPLKFSLERAIEYISSDELVEATPNYLRLRKRELDANTRRKTNKAKIWFLNILINNEIFSYIVSDFYIIKYLP